MGNVKQFPTPENYNILQLQKSTDKALISIAGKNYHGELPNWSILKGLSKEEQIDALTKIEATLTDVIDSYTEMRETVRLVKSRI